MGESGISFFKEAFFAAGMGIPFLFFLACTLYLLRLLFYAGLWRAKAPVLRPSPASLRPAQASLSPDGRKRFAVLIPAHNEALTLGTALQGLGGLEYPAEAYRVYVIADNCTDNTAKIAGNYPVKVLERFDTEAIGKGFALEWAMGILLEDKTQQFDALVILDADTLTSPDLLEAFEAGLKAGHEAMQVRYEVLNADESWRTRLMACALALAHLVKPLGREHLGLSDGLKGNGMCFARSVVERVPWSGASITEDIEYTLRLCRAGIRIAFLPQTAVWAQMPTTGKQAVSQRKRWEGGRYRLLFTVAPEVLKEGFRQKNRRLMDRAAELIIPPFAELFAVPLLLLGVSFLVEKLLSLKSARFFVAGWSTILALEAVYLLGGMWVSRASGRVVLSLLAAPFYVVWKLSLYPMMALSRKSSGEWKRTERREM